MACNLWHDFHFERVTRFIVDMARRFKVSKTVSLAASQLGYRQLIPEQNEHVVGTSL